MIMDLLLISIEIFYHAFIVIVLSQKLLLEVIHPQYRNLLSLHLWVNNRIGVKSNNKFLTNFKKVIYIIIGQII